MRELTAASRSLNLTAGGRCSLANCSSRLNWFIFCVSAPNGTPRWVPSVRLKRSVLLRHAHLFHHGEAGAGDVQQRVLLGGVHGHAVLARHGGIDEFNNDVGADAFDVAIAPLLEGEGGGGAAAFFRRGARRCRPRGGSRFRPAGRR